MKNWGINDEQWRIVKNNEECPNWCSSIFLNNSWICLLEIWRIKRNINSCLFFKTSLIFISFFVLVYSSKVHESLFMNIQVIQIEEFWGSVQIDVHAYSWILHEYLFFIGELFMNILHEYWWIIHEYSGIIQCHFAGDNTWDFIYFNISCISLYTWEFS